jgi:hypothetical protein
MTNTNKVVNIELNEKVFEVDYQSHLSQIFISFRKLQMELKYETHQELVNELSRVDQMRSDVLHIIEFLNFNAVEGYKFAKMLQVISQARRKIKNRLEEREQIKELIKTYEASFKGMLEGAIKDVEKLKKIQDNRSYRLRQLTELEGFNKIIKEQQQKMNIA